MAHRAGEGVALMYVRVKVCPDGCIRLHHAAPGYGPIVHRETRFPMYKDEAVYDHLPEAKAARVGEEAILELDGEGGGSALWVTDEHKVVTCDRLARWKGCYGSWPIKRLQPVQEFAWAHDLGGEA